VHAAPSVRVSLGRSLGWLAFVAVASAAAAANLTAWALLQAGFGASGAGAALAALAAAAVSARLAWREMAPGDLNWDGARWQWDGLDGEVKIALDLDAWMLLRFEPAAGQRRWIAASRRAASGPWPALRAALYSRRPADAIDAPPV
jgi:hypothetical protein